MPARGACPGHRPRPIYVRGGTHSRRIAHAWVAIAFALVMVGCTPTAAVRPAPTSSPSASPSPPASSSPTPSASDSPTPTPVPTATPSGADPAFVPSLAAIQMVGPRLGWAAGSHAIYVTTDGAHWTKQYASTQDYVGGGFISAPPRHAAGL